MQTTTKQLLTIGQGLTALDSAKLTGANAGLVRLTAARNKRAITQVAEDFESARRALIRDLTGGKDEIAEGDPLAKEFHKRLEKALNDPVDVKLWKIAWPDIEAAELTPTAIAQMWEILKDVPEAPAE